MSKIKWLNPSWIDSEVRNQFPHGAYGAQHNPDDVDKLVVAATSITATVKRVAHLFVLEEAKEFKELLQALEPFTKESM